MIAKLRSRSILHSAVVPTCSACRYSQFVLQDCLRLILLLCPFPFSSIIPMIPILDSHFPFPAPSALVTSTPTAHYPPLASCTPPSMPLSPFIRIVRMRNRRRTSLSYSALGQPWAARKLTHTSPQNFGLSNEPVNPTYGIKRLLITSSGSSDSRYLQYG